MCRDGETAAAVVVLGTSMADGGGLLPKALLQAKGSLDGGAFSSGKVFLLHSYLSGHLPVDGVPKAEDSSRGIRLFHLSAYSNSSTSTPIPADHSSKLVVIRGSRCVLFTSDDVPDLAELEMLVELYPKHWPREDIVYWVLLTAERSPPARYSFFIPTSADIFLWTAFRKQRIPAEESDCALFSSELLLNFITDVVGSPDHSSKLVVIRGSRCVLFTSDDVPDLLFPLPRLSPNLSLSQFSPTQTGTGFSEEPESYFNEYENLGVSVEAYAQISNNQQGGAGDVARTLPKALAKRGHRVLVLVITLDSKLFLSKDPAH
ncbi:hypothetical protein ZIOFF_063253 [Zingiber officinale]|uniref:Uncharacterized protein n=1 Tax=Zingiber officinale TaxID=94328 RepID=A0A8J5FAY1_ZINOF|nr:hypothetical protein ZIOFF_063253 [Zingiber officinale]